MVNLFTRYIRVPCPVLVTLNLQRSRIQIQYLDYIKIQSCKKKGKIIEIMWLKSYKIIGKGSSCFAKENWNLAFNKNVMWLII